MVGMNEAEYMPSESEIAAACLRIQATWSAAERRARRGKTPKRIVCDFGAVEARATAENERLLAVRRGAMAS